MTVGATDIHNRYENGHSIHFPRKIQISQENPSTMSFISLLVTIFIFIMHAQNCTQNIKVLINKSYIFNRSKRKGIASITALIPQRHKCSEKEKKEKLTCELKKNGLITHQAAV